MWKLLREYTTSVSGLTESRPRLSCTNNDLQPWKPSRIHSRRLLGTGIKVCKEEALIMWQLFQDWIRDRGDAFIPWAVTQEFLTRSRWHVCGQFPCRYQMQFPGKDISRHPRARSLVANAQAKGIAYLSDGLGPWTRTSPFRPYGASEARSDFLDSQRPALAESSLARSLAAERRKAKSEAVLAGASCDRFPSHSEGQGGPPGRPSSGATGWLAVGWWRRATGSVCWGPGCLAVGKRGEEVGSVRSWADGVGGWAIGWMGSRQWWETGRTLLGCRRAAVASRTNEPSCWPDSPRPLEAPMGALQNKNRRIKSRTANIPFDIQPHTLFGGKPCATHFFYYMESQGDKWTVIFVHRESLLLSCS